MMIYDKKSKPGFTRTYLLMSESQKRTAQGVRYRIALRQVRIKAPSLYGRTVPGAKYRISLHQVRIKAPSFYGRTVPGANIELSLTKCDLKSCRFAEDLSCVGSRNTASAVNISGIVRQNAVGFKIR